MGYYLPGFGTNRLLFCRGVRAMKKRLRIRFIGEDVQKSAYDWVNIDLENKRIGKARCKILGNMITVYSVNIFPEYAGEGFGKHFVETLKERFDVIVADRVRFTASGFWDKMGFVQLDADNRIWRKTGDQAAVAPGVPTTGV